MKEIQIGQRRATVLRDAFVLIGAICAMTSVVAIIQPAAAAAFTTFSAAFGALGLAMVSYFGGDGYAKAKVGALPIPGTSEKL